MRWLLTICVLLLTLCDADSQIQNFGVHEELYPVKKNNKWGYMDSSGNIVISPQFDEAWRFSEGLAVIALGEDWNNRKYGFIDKFGNVVIEPMYQDADYFNEGLARIKLDNKFGFIDNSGKVIIEPLYDGAGFFSDGLAMIRIGDLYTGKKGYINKNGKIVIHVHYDSASDFKEGLAAVRIGDSKDGKFGYVDKNGIFVIQPQFDAAGDFYDGLAAVRIGDTRNGKYGYINKSGSFEILPKFDDAHKFSEGLACVELDGKWGYVNHKGQMVIEPKYDYSKDFKDGFAAVRMDEKFGFIDKSGKIVIEYRFKEAWDFHRGMAMVMDEGDYSYINKEGTAVGKEEIGIQSVDLGLPSGTKWANMNVGASKPEDYGSYFMWGEIEEKPIYNWTYYSLCNGSYKGCYDIGIDIAGTKYDIAHVKWGGDWQMPSSDQLSELIIKCTWIWMTINDVSGYKIIGPNGNSIFLPASGYMLDSELRYANTHGYYWSSSIYISNTACARDLYFHQNSRSLYEIGRGQGGRSVRPVIK